MNNLFTELENQTKQTPLAEVLRPKTIEDFLGQSNVISPKSPLLNLLKTNRLFSLIFWGTPGCGKTTLAELLLKLYPTDHGEIALSGTPYSNLSADIIRSYFSASIQQCHIFSDSIRDNFTRLHPGITDEKIWQALDTACLGNDVRIMPMKLDEPMGENGSRLSGGQRNRLLTALAIASDAPCLILDEPTDGLDKITGARLIENVISHIQQNGKTLILITHDAEAASKFPRELLLSQP